MANTNFDAYLLVDWWSDPVIQTLASLRVSQDRSGFWIELH
jgi:hypothetical protein